MGEKTEFKQVEMNLEAEEKTEKIAKKNRVITAGCNICCHLSFMIATIVVLVTDTSSCKYPIRAWLVAYVVLSVFGAFGSFFIELCIQRKHLKKKLIQKLYCFYYLLFILFFITWTILGSVWVYKDDNCKHSNSYSDFEHGWKLIVAILAINYILCIICSFAGCTSVIYILTKTYIFKSLSKPSEIHNN